MISSELKEARESLGFSSARSFYHDFLSRKCKLDFNYSYYMKIEGGRALPSASIVSTIAATLKPELQARLIRAYCRDLFPQHAALFSIATPKHPALKAPAQPQSTSATMLVKQRHLTESQVACLARSQEHYYLFLVLTLARKPVGLEELKSRLSRGGGPETLKSGNFRKVLSDLEAAKLAHVEGEEADCSTKEMKFPAADTDSLKKLYRNIDEWNLGFSKSMQFEEPLNKMIIRRVSRRYHTLLLSQAQLMFDLLKASDEVQQDYNDEVVMMNFSLARGDLPG